MSDRGTAQLKDAAAWFEGREPHFICYPTLPPAFKRAKKGDWVVVFDWSNGKTKGRVKIAKLLEMHDYPSTKDGRYFLVLRYRRRGNRRLTKVYWRSLVERGFVSGKQSLARVVLQGLGRGRLEILKQDFELPTDRQ
jgi:hypothetical protein